MLRREAVMVTHVVEGGHDPQAAVASPGVVTGQAVVTTSLDVEGHEVKAVASLILEQVVPNLAREEAVNLPGKKQYVGIAARFSFPVQFVRFI